MAVDSGLELLGKAVLLAAGAVAERPDAVLTALLAAEVTVLCLWLTGWTAVIFWVFDG